MYFLMLSVISVMKIPYIIWFENSCNLVAISWKQCIVTYFHKIFQKQYRKNKS